MGNEITAKKDKNNQLRAFLGRQEVVVALVLAALCIFLAIIRPATFPTVINIFNILRQSSLYAILAIGMALVIITTGIDLSIGSLIAFSACFGAWLAQRTGAPAIIVLLAILAAGAAAGFVNGALVAKAGIPPFIVTLGMMSVAKGAALLISNGSPIRYSATWLSKLGGGYIGPVPIAVLVMAAVVIFGVVFANNTLTGRNIYVIGNSARAAKLSGIHVDRTTILVYVINGLLCGVCAVLLIGQMNSADPSFGSGYEMDAIAASVIGGISMSGGEGRIGGTVVGALLMAVLKNMFVLLAVSGYWQTIILGIVIVFSVAIDCVRKKNQAR